MTGTAGTAGARGRRTEAALLADIRAAVIAELREVGIGRLTMEGIAKRSGTAKTSLYRRWSVPSEVLLDALEHDFPQEPVSPAMDDLRGDLVNALRLLTEWLSTPTADAIASVLGEGARYPELTEAIYARVFDAHGGRFTRTVLLRYAEQGDIDPDLVTDVVTDIGEALVFKYLADTGKDPDVPRLERIVDRVILPAVGRPPPGRAARGPCTSGWGQR